MSEEPRPDGTPPVPSAAEPLLEIDRLSVEFAASRRTTRLKAVDDVSLTIGAGRTLGLVG